MGWRWFGLLAISASVLHTWLAARAGEPVLASFLSARGGAFAPATAAFALLGAVHLGLVTYGVGQLTARYEHVRVLDALAPAAGLAALLASLELVAAGQDLAWLVAPLGLGLVLATHVLYRRAHVAIAAGTGPRGVGAPFALWFAWSSALLPGKLAAAGWSIDEAGVALVALLAVVALGYGLKYRDAVLPGATAWLLLQLTTAQPQMVRGVALAGAAACAVFAVVELTVRVFGAPAAPPARERIRARVDITRNPVYLLADG